MIDATILTIIKISKDFHSRFTADYDYLFSSHSKVSSMEFYSKKILALCLSSEHSFKELSLAERGLTIKNSMKTIGENVEPCK